MATQMNKKKKRDVKLPDEMLFEILSWLPAKSVCISKCCSKSFLNLTNSPNFAIKQSQNSLLKHDSYFFIQDFFMEDCRIAFIKNPFELIDHVIPNTKIYSSLQSSSLATNQIPREGVGVPSKFLRYVDENSVRILASSNGLLLCQSPLTKGQKQIFICNPITQSHSFIPSPFTRGGVMFSFECNNNNDEDYKLYAFYEDSIQSEGSLVCSMYIPKKGVWKEREPRLILGKMYLNFGQLPVFYKGSIHFPIHKDSRKHKHLVSYNVESGVSRIIELPDEEAMRGYDKEEGIFKLGESVCWVNLKVHRKVKDAFTIWVLSDYESSSGGNWSKIFSVSLKDMRLKLDGKCSQVMGFTVMNGRSLIFATKAGVYDYDLSGEKETRLEKVCDHKLPPYSRVRLLPYIDTLRSCDIGSTTLRV